MTEETDHALCAGSPLTWAAAGDTKCGGGLPQPTWAVCTRSGSWHVQGRVHAYCPTHAARLVRHALWLDTAAHEAERRRAEKRKLHA